MASPRGDGSAEACPPGDANTSTEAGSSSFAPASKYRPNTTAICMADPRQSDQVALGIVAFYYPGKNEPCDDVCQGHIFGNFWEDGDLVELDGVRFRNAEGAFQAMKFWSKAQQFSQLDGGQVFAMKKQLEASAHADRTYKGRGSNWRAMLEVLRAKFRPEGHLAGGLLATGDALLLEHNSTPGRDLIWSNNHIGNGKNWLGMQLMLVRDELHAGPRHTGSWTHFLQEVCKFNLDSGEPLDGAGAQTWMQIVQAATDQVLKHLAQVSPAGTVCRRPGCSRPTWNGQPGEYCSRTCRNADAQTSGTQAATADRPTCIRLGCGHRTYNGLPGHYCSKACKAKAQQEAAQPDPSAVEAVRQIGQEGGAVGSTSAVPVQALDAARPDRTSGHESGDASQVLLAEPSAQRPTTAKVPAVGSGSECGTHGVAGVAPTQRRRDAEARNSETRNCKDRVYCSCSLM
mmetsp:Transcript_16933/g.39445  ORF Transcript_16933/g.39445 Transcript_16933/m.39445 type:complete len:458 (+) Transcript_16933:47-1420(+)